MKKLVPFIEGCARLGYHPQHARKLIKQGKLRAPIRLVDGGRPFFVDEELDEIVAQRIAKRDGVEAAE